MQSTDDADTLGVCAHKRARPQEADNDNNINPDRIDRWAIIFVLRIRIMPMSWKRYEGKKIFSSVTLVYFMIHFLFRYVYD